MKIYTKTGDEGETGLYDGPRVTKSHARIEAYGEIDELNSVIGIVRAEELTDEMDQLLGRIQNDLFAVGAELATPDPQSRGTDFIQDEDVLTLEAVIDAHEASLKPLKQFILPGGTKPSAMLHCARSVCRRAERRIVALQHAEDQQVSKHVLKYVNRLSDLLFVLARAVNAIAGQHDVTWEKPARS